MHYATCSGNSEIVTLLLSLGLDVHAKTKAGSTVLHLAAYKNEFNQELINVLLSHGADVQAQDTDGNTPLHIVRNKDFALRLLSLGADIEAQNMHGNTPLHEASSSGLTDIVTLLLAHGADVHAQNTKGKTARIAALDLDYEKPTEIIWLLEQYENKQS